MAQAKTYKELRTELDDILLQLQDPSCDIEEAVKLYEAGAKASKALESYLKTAETKIDKLTSK